MIFDFQWAPWKINTSIHRLPIWVDYKLAVYSALFLNCCKIRKWIFERKEKMAMAPWIILYYLGSNFCTKKRSSSLYDLMCTKIFSNYTKYTVWLSFWAITIYILQDKKQNVQFHLTTTTEFIVVFQPLKTILLFKIFSACFVLYK